MTMTRYRLSKGNGLGDPETDDVMKYNDFMQVGRDDDVSDIV